MQGLDKRLATPGGFGDEQRAGVAARQQLFQRPGRFSSLGLDADGRQRLAILCRDAARR